MSSYEPYYLSKKYEWKNEINSPPKERATNALNLNLADQMIHQVIDLLLKRNVEETTIRQVMITWLETQAIHDPQLLELDKKVVLDSQAFIRENI